MQWYNFIVGQRFSYSQSSLLFSDLPFLENQQKSPETVNAQGQTQQQQQISEQNNKRKRENDGNNYNNNNKRFQQQGNNYQSNNRNNNNNWVSHFV
jgi:hypothetical protein